VAGSLEARVARLEKIRHEPNSSWVDARTRAERAEADGTASLAQYELVYSEELVGWRDQFLASIPALVAREKIGPWPWGMVCQALVYPPDQELSEEADDWLDSIVYQATISVDQMKKNAKTRQAPLLVTTPEQRTSQAILILTMGGRYALGLRTRAWTKTDGQWHTSEEAMTLARTTTESLSEATRFLGYSGNLVPHLLDGTLQTVDGTIPDNPRRALVSWADLADTLDRIATTSHVYDA
jgi:hypothetical protein